MKRKDYCWGCTTNLKQKKKLSQKCRVCEKKTVYFCSVNCKDFHNRYISLKDIEKLKGRFFCLYCNIPDMDGCNHF